MEINRPRKKPGRKTGRFDCTVIGLPPIDEAALAAWRRNLVFDIVGRMMGSQLVVGYAHKIKLRAGISDQPRSILAVATEIVGALVVAGVVPSGESVTDLQLTWDRAVPSNTISVEIKSTIPPASRAPAEARRAHARRASERLNRLAAVEARI